METKTGKHDTLIILITVAIVALFYLFFYFQTSGINPLDGSPPSLPQPIGIDPVTQNANIGDTVTVGVVGSEVVGLYGIQFDLSYNSGILELQSVDGGDFLKTGGATTFCTPYKTDNPGLIKDVACTRLGKAEGVTGSGTLMIIEFTARTSGTSDMQLTNVKIADIDANVLDLGASSGKVVVR
ncbi:MAG: cohesin domain-containing protein [Candidatus Thorarchaeota archaeon]|jgi:hypothetical protein